MTARKLGGCLLVSFLALTAAAQEDPEKALWQAARRGDAATVKALLGQGVDVNAKFRYDATALSYACDRGHVEVVKILLEHGANPNVKDTFYGATPLQWAASPASDPPSMVNNYKIVSLLLEHGAEGAASVLQNGARSGSTELVEILLAKAKFSPETLTLALNAAQQSNQKETAVLLRGAGAVPPPRLSPETLQQYAGTYQDEAEQDYEFTVQESRLMGGPAGERKRALVPVGEHAFAASGGVRFQFQLEAGSVQGMILRDNRDVVHYKRVESKQP